jgi:hypothetical protein
MKLTSHTRRPQSSAGRKPVSTRSQTASLYGSRTWATSMCTCGDHVVQMRGQSPAGQVCERAHRSVEAGVVGRGLGGVLGDVNTMDEPHRLQEVSSRIHGDRLQGRSHPASGDTCASDAIGETLSMDGDGPSRVGRAQDHLEGLDNSPRTPRRQTFSCEGSDPGLCLAFRPSGRPTSARYSFDRGKSTARAERTARTRVRS